MASGPQHYRDAEDDLEFAKQCGEESERGRFYLQMATVHATLALAAATAIGTIDPQGGLEIGDAQAWEAATGSSREGTCPGGC